MIVNYVVTTKNVFIIATTMSTRAIAVVSRFAPDLVFLWLFISLQCAIAITISNKSNSNINYRDKSHHINRKNNNK